LGFGHGRLEHLHILILDQQSAGLMLGGREPAQPHKIKSLSQIQTMATTPKSNADPLFPAQLQMRRLTILLGIIRWNEIGWKTNDPAPVGSRLA
jgi:hypothetical protein